MAASIPLVSALVSALLPATAPPPEGSWYQPDIDVSWQIQLQGPINSGYTADLYVLDLFDTPQNVIDDLHASGRRVSATSPPAPSRTGARTRVALPLPTRGDAWATGPGNAGSIPARSMSARSCRIALPWPPAKAATGWIRTMWMATAIAPVFR